jgi:gliding motility-associated-like protein
MKFTHPFVLSVLLLAGLTPIRSMAQYQVNGNAAQTACNCWRLTNASNGENGSVWNVNLFNLSNPFNFTFDVFLGCNDGGADGIAFVLQALSVNAGSSGGGIGYQGINPSLAVELDNYQNGGEPGFDHMALQMDGDVSHGGPNTLAGPVQISASTGNVEDCAWHILNIQWNPATQSFTVYFDGVLRLSYTGDIINNVFGGNPNVYWGFTSATGGANNLHQFCNSLNPAFIITSPIQCDGFPVDFQSSSVVATGLITAFQWDFGDGGTATGTQVSHTYATAGNYNVTLTITSEGCTQSSAVQVTINPTPNFTLGPDQAICDGDSYQMNPVGLVGGETVAWSPSAGLTNAGIPNPVATPTVTTTYTLNVSSAGCTSSDDITITFNPLPVADAGPDQSICDGEVTLMAASGGTQYAWSPITDLANPASPTTQASPLMVTNYTVTVTDANGCVNTDNMTITVDPLPAVNAGVDDSMCNGQNVQLDASGAVNYSWSPIAGLNNPISATPTFNGNATTTFTVTGTDINGCQNTDDVTVTVFPLPVAAFAQPANACLGNPTSFDNNCTGTGLAYSWNFGDGTPTDNTSDPTHTYNVTGNFNVVLSISDVNGCQATANSTATVLPLPSAAMNIFDGQEFCENELIQFENESTGSIASLRWDFGNNEFLPAFPNTTSTLQDPAFAYPNFAFSPFTVELEVIDAAGCYDQVQVVIIVHDEPVADFNAPNVCEGGPMAFTDVSSVILAVIDTWTWNFGDGLGNSALQNPNYQYGSDGVYPVQLTVETEYGCSSFIIKDVLVNPTPVVALSGIDTCLNDQTTFANASTPQDATIVSWDWDLGDGTLASGPPPTYTYLLNGIYNVSLTATTDSGCVASGTTQVEVFPNPQPAFDMVFAEGCTPHEVLFVNQSTLATGFIAGYQWDFGDGTTSTAGSPQYTYVDSGYYDITLAATSVEGCTTVLTVADAVRANITPVADFSIADDELSLLDAEAVLTDLSQHALTWNWNLGDGTTSATPSPTHIYTEPGTFDLILTVTNGDCEDVHFGQIRVTPIVTFYIPSAFTPDEDGINETFFGVGESILTYNMKITDRWGELLFESNSPDFPWDGKYKSRPVDSGLYIYEFNLLDLFGQSHRYVGGVQLLR